MDAHVHCRSNSGEEHENAGEPSQQTENTNKRSLGTSQPSEDDDPEISKRCRKDHAITLLSPGPSLSTPSLPENQYVRQIQPKALRLACHFQMRNPEQHLRCSDHADLNNLTLYLIRYHQCISNYCLRCPRVFKSEQEKDAHILKMTSNPCDAKTPSIPEGLSQVALDWLRGKKFSGLPQEDTWYMLWDAFFLVQLLADPSGHQNVHWPGWLRRLSMVTLCHFLKRQGPQMLLSFSEEKTISP